ncbi:hypothetical protein CspeluHIS016_0200630 [Cutaneotrichosporon spelunceum]|uniref:CENP-V/GFA domain-containing protein n=1 Tax=Cutaneotrichosporon spelunceum TaxID=1672016 RepID=A0AAD3TQL4_9TREE|nr:hypothetical protein CspeluHIS016_0200630 [Cutaneotrichosporon spelunceum]
MKLAGECNCGAVTMSVSGEPSIISICHCTDCRRFTGHVSAYIIAFDAAEITGPVRGWTTRAESGKEAVRFFCPHCGSGVYARHIGEPRVFINGGLCIPGTLAPPTKEFWMRSAEPWDAAYPNTFAMEFQPLREPIPQRRLEWATAEGRCNCGQIRVGVKTIQHAVVCSCTTCRRFTGSISAYLAIVGRDDLEMVGRPKTWSSLAESGRRVRRMFCGECGSSIAIEHDARVEVYGGILPLGSLPPPEGQRFRQNVEKWAKAYPVA